LSLYNNFSNNYYPPITNLPTFNWQIILESAKEARAHLIAVGIHRFICLRTFGRKWNSIVHLDICKFMHNILIKLSLIDEKWSILNYGVIASTIRFIDIFSIILRLLQLIDHWNLTNAYNVQWTHPLWVIYRMRWKTRYMIVKTILLMEVSIRCNHFLKLLKHRFCDVIVCRDLYQPAATSNINYSEFTHRTEKRS